MGVKSETVDTQASVLLVYPELSCLRLRPNRLERVQAHVGIHAGAP